MCLLFFFFNDTATTEIYTLSLHDALPIYTAIVWVPPSTDGPQKTVAEGLKRPLWSAACTPPLVRALAVPLGPSSARDRKSTRLNSSHANISYAVFCLKKKISYLIEYCLRY